MEIKSIGICLTLFSLFATCASYAQISEEDKCLTTAKTQEELERCLKEVNRSDSGGSDGSDRGSGTLMPGPGRE